LSTVCLLPLTLARSSTTKHDDRYYLKNGGSGGGDGLDWIELDPITGDTTVLLENIFIFSETSPTLTPDGMILAELNGGSIRLLEAATGNEIDVLSGIQSGPAGPGYDVSVTTDGRFLYTWTNTPATTVFAYDFSGRLVTTFPLPYPSAGGVAGFSISYANGMLWVIDTGGAIGNWIGYTLSQVDPPVPPAAGENAFLAGSGSKPTQCGGFRSASCD